MNFFSDGNITINGNTDHPVSDDHTTTNNTTDNNSSNINDNSSHCTFYNRRVNQQTTHQPPLTHHTTTNNPPPPITSLNRASYVRPHIPNTYVPMQNNSSFNRSSYLPPRPPPMSTSINHPTSYPSFDNYKGRIFQDSDQYKQTGKDFRAESRNEEIKQRKQFRKHNNIHGINNINLNNFNTNQYGFEDLLNDIEYTNNSVEDMDKSYFNLVNSNSNNTLFNNNIHTNDTDKYNNINHKNKYNTPSHKSPPSFGINNTQSYNNNNNNNNNNYDNRLCSDNNQMELPDFHSSLFTHELDIDQCNKIYKILTNICDDLPHVICADIAECATGVLLECNHCSNEILALQQDVYSNSRNFYFQNPNVNTNKNTNNIDVNDKINTFCRDCKNKLVPCQYKINEYTGALNMNIYCSAMFINDNVNNKCLECRNGRKVYINGVHLKICCGNYGYYTYPVMGGSSNSCYGSRNVNNNRY